MSFSLTEEQFLNGSKDVTRRLGWMFLNAGDRVLGVRKAMGLKKGEHPVPLGVIEIVSVRRERLDAISDDDVRREGFAGLTSFGFVEMFCKHMKCSFTQMVTRIEFKHVEDQR